MRPLRVPALAAELVVCLSLVHHLWLHLIEVDLDLESCPDPGLGLARVSGADEHKIGGTDLGSGLRVAWKLKNLD